MITNQGYDAATAVRITVERAWIYRPETAWFYSHHPSLTFFNGRYYAIWSNGRRDEDAPGQRVLIASSENFLNWTEPEPLLDTLPGLHSEQVLTAAGFHQHDGQLVAYAGAYEYRPECLDENGQRRPGDKGHMNTALLALTSRDGRTWNGPADLRLPIVPNHGPQCTASGRLIISGNVSFPNTDDPCGLSNWRMTGIYPASLAETVADDSEGFWKVQEAAGWPDCLCEGSFYQTNDGVLHMLLRTNTERLWLTESSDDGATWSSPKSTEFSDNATKFHVGRLPDGRFYYVGCPDPEPRWQRSPLVLSLSEDGIHFDRHHILADDSTPYEQRAVGMHKGGDYGYPHTLVHNGCLHVIVSRRKEAVEVLRVRDVPRASSSGMKKVPRASSSGIGISDRQYLPEQDAPATLFQVAANWATLMIKHGENLPHWTCESAVYHVAFRLSDSVPSEARDAWIRERDAILAHAEQCGRSLSEDEEKRLQYLYSEKIERYLDAGHGVCHLKNPAIADMVANALCHFDGERYRLHAWCVMPNTCARDRRTGTGTAVGQDRA